MLQLVSRCNLMFDVLLLRADIDYYCNAKSFDLILVAWNEPLLETG